MLLDLLVELIGKTYVQMSIYVACHEKMLFFQVILRFETPRVVASCDYLEQVR
jgi:hypothetical protein